jgi:hypothetical protein
MHLRIGDMHLTLRNGVVAWVPCHCLQPSPAERMTNVSLYASDITADTPERIPSASDSSSDSKRS